MKLSRYLFFSHFVLNPWHLNLWPYQRKILSFDIWGHLTNLAEFLPKVTKTFSCAGKKVNMKKNFSWLQKWWKMPRNLSDESPNFCFRQKNICICVPKTVFHKPFFATVTTSRDLQTIKTFAFWSRKCLNYAFFYKTTDLYISVKYTNFPKSKTRDQPCLKMEKKFPPLSANLILQRQINCPFCPHKLGHFMCI